MPDLDDMLGQTPEVWTGNEEKKGAPVLDMDDLGSLLGEEPQVWGGNEEKRGAPVLEEQVMLDDPGSYTPEEKRGDVQLEGSMDDILGGNDPAAYDPVAEFCTRLQFDDALKEKFKTLDAEQQQQVTAMRAQQLGIPAPMIPNELRPKIGETLPEDTEVELEEAPQVEEYKPSFKDEDLERIKEESKKPQKYTPPPMELSEEKKKENRRIMNELREERERELAHKGFIQLLILTGVGVVGAVAFAIFFSGAFGLGYKQETELAWLSTVKNIAPVIGVIMAISALALAAPVPQLKGVTKFLFGVGFILSLFPGIPLFIQKDGHGPLNALFLVLAAAGTFVVVFMMTTSDAIAMYNKYGNTSS